MKGFILLDLGMCIKRTFYWFRYILIWMILLQIIIYLPETSTVAVDTEASRTKWILNGTWTLQSEATRVLLPSLWGPDMACSFKWQNCRCKVCIRTFFLVFFLKNLCSFLLPAGELIFEMWVFVCIRSLRFMGVVWQVLLCKEASWDYDQRRIRPGVFLKGFSSVAVSVLCLTATEGGTGIYSTENVDFDSTTLLRCWDWWDSMDAAASWTQMNLENEMLFHYNIARDWISRRSLEQMGSVEAQGGCAKKWSEGVNVRRSERVK